MVMGQFKTEADAIRASLKPGELFIDKYFEKCSRKFDDPEEAARYVAGELSKSKGEEVSDADMAKLSLN